MPKTGLVYVVYAPFGLAPLQQFVASYRRHPAGIDHELILVCKAFGSETLPESHHALLDGLPHRALFVPDGGFDLGSYFLAARACEHWRLCFLNSRSVILADGWLGKLGAALDEPGVGLVGATGNYESNATSLWTLPGPPDPGLVPHLRRRCRVLLTTWEFPGFPNPHLRTNAFLIDRRRFLALKAGPFRSKRDCYRFESGRRSLTRQVRARGAAVRVVGRDGGSFPPERWRESGTFRVDEQSNLLVADNQTREYLAADADKRRWLASFAWEKQHG